MPHKLNLTDGVSVASFSYDNYSANKKQQQQNEETHQEMRYRNVTLMPYVTLHLY